MKIYRPLEPCEHSEDTMEVTRAIMEADDSFDKSGDSGTRDWLEEHLLEKLEARGFRIVKEVS